MMSSSNPINQRETTTSAQGYLTRFQDVAYLSQNASRVPVEGHPPSSKGFLTAHVTPSLAWAIQSRGCPYRSHTGGMFCQPHI